MDTFVNVEDGNGLEVWRQLSQDAEPKGTGFQRGRLGAIMNPTAQGSFKAKVEKWEAQVKAYEALTKKAVDEDVKISVLQEKLAPPEVQEHLYLHAARLTRWASQCRTRLSWSLRCSLVRPASRRAGGVA